MFMNEPDFDDEFTSSPGFEYGQAFPSPDSKQRQLENRPPANRGNLGYEEADDNDDLPSFRNAGGSSTPQNSRAKMLTQQREIQMKKRMANIQNGGMIRSSLDTVASNSPMRQSADNQNTPAIRQFSAPKAANKDPSFDASPDKDSEFTKKGRTSNVPTKNVSSSSSRYNNKRYSDDEEDSRAAGASRRAEERHHRERDGAGRDNRDARGSSDRGDNRDRQGDSRRSGNGSSNRRSKYDEEDDEDYDLPEDYRRGGKSGSRSTRDNRDDRNGRDNGRDDYTPSTTSNSRSFAEDRDQDSRPSTSKWAGATGGRDVNSSQQASSGDHKYKEVTALPLASNNSRVAQPQTAQAPLANVPPDLSDMRAFLTSPLPRNVGVLQCYIRRNKSGTNKLFPIYSLYLKEGDVFLMASKKRPKNKTSNYLISMDQNDLHRTGRGYLGKLRSNFVGTEFQVFDNGVNPKDTEPDEAAYANGAVRCELGSVMYAANVLGSRGPRKMQVALPGLDESQRIIKWKDTGAAGEGGEGGEDILTRMKDRNLRDLVYLINKPPRWNEQVGAYVLNFNGRVTMASVKNFQLVDPDEQNAVVLQFGRVGKDEFTMDLQYPISPFQAFAVTLSSFDSKIACD